MKRRFGDIEKRKKSQLSIQRWQDCAREIAGRERSEFVVVSRGKSSTNESEKLN